MDILIPLGGDSNWDNNELRYALRSIERYATGYNRIFVIGTNPGFLRQNEQNLQNTGNLKSRFDHSVNSVRFFPLADLPANKQARIAYKIAWAFNHTDISDEIAFWNDDFVLTAPVDVTTIPYYYRATLEESARVLPDGNAYRLNLLATNRRLKHLGRPALDYDCHAPVRYMRQHFNALAALWMESAVLQSGYVVKSTYCNHLLAGNSDLISGATGSCFPDYLNPPVLFTDCKIRTHSLAEIMAAYAGRWIFSYSDSALFDTGNPIPDNIGLKRWLTHHFPNKSKWEK